MAFPTTTVLELFTGAGALSASWTAPAFTGDSVPVRYNDVCVGPGSLYSSALWNAATYGPDAEVFVTIPAVATGAATIVLWCKIKNPNTGTACYYGAVFSVGGDTIDFVRAFNNSEVGIGTQTSFAISPGDKVGMVAKTVGADIVIEAWTDNGSGWNLRKTYTDTGAVAAFPALASAGGNLAFAQYTGGNTDVTRSIDDFGGGTVVVGGGGTTPHMMMMGV